MATVSNAPGIPSSRAFTPYMDHEESLSTIPDPRSRVSSPTVDSPPIAIPEQYTELSNAHLTDEVTTLSQKLINAINQQTTLDDSLSATRHELETARERNKQLERENKEHEALLSNGVLIRSSVAEAEKAKLVAALAEEKSNRRGIEKEKKSIELELENLTTALFEEANKVGLGFVVH